MRILRSPYFKREEPIVWLPTSVEVLMSESESEAQFHKGDTLIIEQVQSASAGKTSLIVRSSDGRIWSATLVGTRAGENIVHPE
jgi:hypothetical protein